ncbi:heparan-sulfate 6-O-sulfotransferase 3-like [Ptychodera flava]|uniref:heparan-sulfate 6-O-sulfotransferase 3-like n=1 Tax=Ptychodera flava TaxID=63121 RepID=UPI00396A7FAB
MKKSIRAFLFVSFYTLSVLVVYLMRDSGDCTSGQRTVEGVADTQQQQQQQENVAREKRKESSPPSPPMLNENDIRTKENVDCSALVAEIRSKSKEKKDVCHRLDKALRHCYNDSTVGREPLPNFYVFQNASDRSAYRQYRESNIAFVHLPKAGGTSVEKILSEITVRRKRIKKTPVWHCGNLYNAALSAKDKPTPIFFYSKRTYGIHDFVNPSRPFVYVTWFREPISRLVSTFHFLRKKRCFSVHSLCKKYILPSASLTQYLKRTENVAVQDMDNYYVRLLQFGDFPDVDDTFEDCCGAVTANDAHKIPRIEEKHYRVAKRNLEKIAFIGLMEDFKTSQDMVSTLFGLPVAKEETHANANPHSNVLTDYEQSELRRRNVWDLKLYEDAKRIYQLQKEAYLEMLNNRK